MKDIRERLQDELEDLPKYDLDDKLGLQVLYNDRGCAVRLAPIHRLRVRSVSKL